ncbi:MAG: aspartate/glutamate racemase family protein [Desulfobacteraceae bacterium]|nr:aspartate/glutamate racemase family protein [Desulfobacteraceae bacterium]
MKLIGLIGGISWESTVEYYRHINRMVAERLGGFHSARVVLYSVDFDEIEKAQHENRWNDAAQVLANAARALERAGAEIMVMCANTMHKVADKIEEGIKLKLLHIGDVTGEAIVKQGLKTVGLLGTRFTMEEQFYRGRLEDRFKLRVLVPDKEDIETVNRIIYEELCKGEIEASSRQAYVEVIGRLVNKGAEGIILGCTEIPLLIGPKDVDIPLFDTTALHAQAAVDLALS